MLECAVEAGAVVSAPRPWSLTRGREEFSANQHTRD